MLNCELDESDQRLDLIHLSKFLFPSTIFSWVAAACDCASQFGLSSFRDHSAVSSKSSLCIRI